MNYFKPAFERENDNGSVMQRKLFAHNDLGVFQQDGARCHTSAVTTKCGIGLTTTSRHT